ncbi:unnamed protein product [Paramecium primaurelia]|uniref:Uncharacterized protein n=1 Tax=Paramecium primaurelia TaxID=5886 RepID=A0A8S1KZP5_PARPR|nr:unnamed protein product [Paramecium primaurelia]
MIPIVPFLKSFVQEGQQFFTAKDEFEKKQNELMQFILDITQSLDQVEYFDNIQEELYTNEEKQFIKQCKDLLHLSEQLVQQLPSNLTLINGYLYSKTSHYKELLHHLEELNKISSQIRQLELQSYEVLKTVIVPSLSRKVSFQSMHEVSIFLKLKAPKEIKEIFNQYPRHLKSEYTFKIHIDDNDHSKNVYNFSRKEFMKLQQIKKDAQIYTISKKQHCTLELRNIQQNQFIKKKSQRLETQFDTPLHKVLDQEQDNKTQILRLYLIVNGQNGINIIRDQNQRIYVGCGEEFGLQEKDEIIILSNSNQETLISYIIQRFIIKQL